MRTTDFTWASRQRSESSNTPRFLATGVMLADMEVREFCRWVLAVREPNRIISVLLVLSCKEFADIQFWSSSRQAVREDRQLGLEVLSGR